MNLEEQSPWLCHICERKSTEGEAEACSVCYKITCNLHLKRVPVENESGLLLLQPLCIYCEMENMV